MKLVRQLSAVLVVVGIVVGAGFAWKASPMSSLIADDRGGDRRVAAAPAPGQVAGGPPPDAPDRRFDRRGDSVFSLSNADDLAQTLVELGLVIGAVVGLDLIRRRRRSDRLHGATLRSGTP